VRNVLPFFAVVSLVAAACGGSGSSHRSPPPRSAGGAQPNFAMPWMVGIPQTPPGPAPGTGFVPGPAATAPTGLSPARDKCMSDTGAGVDCQEALGQLAKTQAPLYDVYKKACGLKVKLQGCGVFKSTAVGEGDRAQVEALMRCESGQWESCEDVSTKSAPLQAWLATLKTEGCKKGQSALCKNYKECRGKTEWGCKPAGATPTGGAPPKEVCGCVPKQCGGPLTVTPSPTAKTWPDGSQRGSFACAP
jgi:hypothetical protein